MAERIRFEGVWKAYPRWDGHDPARSAEPATARPARRRAQRWALRDVSSRSGRASWSGSWAKRRREVDAAAAGRRPDRADAGAGHAAGGSMRCCPSATSSTPAHRPRERDHDRDPERAPPRRAREMIPPSSPSPSSRASRTAAAHLQRRHAAPARFRVLAQLEPDALLIDEVLAVGRPPLPGEVPRLRPRAVRRGHRRPARLAQPRSGGPRCGKAIWLQAGAIRAFGEAEAVVAEYREAMHSETRDRTPPPGGASGELELRRNRFGSQEATIAQGRAARRSSAG